MRHAMWSAVSSRHHHPAQIYAFGAKNREVMIHGTVEFEFKDGRKGTVPWAARARFPDSSNDGVEEELKMEFYQVYLVRQCSWSFDPGFLRDGRVEC